MKAKRRYIESLHNQLLHPQTRKRLTYWTFLGAHRLSRPEWMPINEFPWRIMFCTVTTFAVAMMIRTPLERQ